MKKEGCGWSFVPQATKFIESQRKWLDGVQEAETNRTWWISTFTTVRVPAHIIAIKDGQGTGKPKVSKIQQGNLEANDVKHL